MNQPDAFKNNANLATGAKTHDHESILSKIIAGLKTISMSQRLKVHTRFQYQSFIDANLLDDVMEPEISHTLRR